MLRAFCGTPRISSPLPHRHRDQIELVTAFARDVCRGEGTSCAAIDKKAQLQKTPAKEPDGWRFRLQTKHYVTRKFIHYNTVTLNSTLEQADVIPHREGFATVHVFATADSVHRRFSVDLGDHAIAYADA